MTEEGLGVPYHTVSRVTLGTDEPNYLKSAIEDAKGHAL